MQFRTVVKGINQQGLIDHSTRVLMIGSCFTENIGKRLAARLFNVTVNPFGPLYNPMSIAGGLDRLVSQLPYTEADIFLSDGLWHSFDFHSRYSSADQSRALEMMNESVNGFQIPDVLIVTLGSDATFTLKSIGQVVANCHKLPSQQFKLEHQSVEAIITTLKQSIRRLRRLNEQIQVIFTVSPVRHLSYGAAVNSRAKGRLIEAALEIADTVLGVSYFPAYEIMMDDLRDYRFYADDMLHPSEVAVDYIYQIFSDSYFTDDTVRLADECLKLTRRLAHRPMGDNPDAHRQFMDATLLQARSLMKRYPKLIHSIEKLIHNHAL